LFNSLEPLIVCGHVEVVRLETRAPGIHRNGYVTPGSWSRFRLLLSIKGGFGLFGCERL